jgi:hypothetical protein
MGKPAFNTGGWTEFATSRMRALGTKLPALPTPEQGGRVRPGVPEHLGNGRRLEKNCKSAVIPTGALGFQGNSHKIRRGIKHVQGFRQEFTGRRVDAGRQLRVGIIGDGLGRQRGAALPVCPGGRRLGLDHLVQLGGLPMQPAQPAYPEPPAILSDWVALERFQVTFYVKRDGGGEIRTEEVVKANSATEARRLIEARYGRGKVRITGIRKVPGDRGTEGEGRNHAG